MERGEWKEESGKRRVERGEWKEETGDRRQETRLKKVKSTKLFVVYSLLLKITLSSLRYFCEICGKKKT